jgi:hypothetical protein
MAPSVQFVHAVSEMGSVCIAGGAQRATVGVLSWVILWKVMGTVGGLEGDYVRGRARVRPH